MAIFVTLLVLTTGWIASAEESSSPLATEAQTEQRTLSESEAEARRLSGKPVPTKAEEVPDAETMCTICYVCGGNWPNFAGAIYTPNGAIERDGDCGNFFYNPYDASPYLCCR
jgi:hypothetical protein